MPILDPLSIQLDSVAPPNLATPKPQRKLLRRVENSDDFILELDYSSISPFLECARKGENVLVHSRKGVGEQTALNWGNLFHKMEEIRLLHGLSVHTLERQNEVISKWFLDHPVSIDEFRNPGRMIDTLSRYYKLYASDNWHNMVAVHEGEKMVERPYKIELCSILVNSDLPYVRGQLIIDERSACPTTKVGSIHVLLTGKIDCILSTPSGFFVVDHKTSSRGGKEFEEAFGLSLQPRGYTWAARQLGIPVLGCYLNGVIVRPLTKTGTGTDFVRQPFFYDESSLRDYEQSMRAIAEDFVHCLVRGYFPQTGARSFKSLCPSCDYHQNCRLPFNQRATDLASNLYENLTWSAMDQE